MTNSRLGTEILVPSPPRYTNNPAGTKDRAGQPLPRSIALEGPNLIDALLTVAGAK
jgi:hypothetical protein